MSEGTLKQSTFDVALYGFIGLSDGAPSAGVLSHILTVLKQNGSILLKSVNEPVGQTLESLLRCAGFVTVQKADDNIWQASKPSYEVGSSVPLKRNKKVNSNVAQVWTLTNTLDDDIIDSDTLLTSEDWQKPDLTAAKGLTLLFLPKVAVEILTIYSKAKSSRFYLSSLVYHIICRVGLGSNVCLPRSILKLLCSHLSKN